MTGIKIRLLGDRVSRRTAWQVARQHDWDTLRDAEYIALTRLQADALVTVDPRRPPEGIPICGSTNHRKPGGIATTNRYTSLAA